MHGLLNGFCQIILPAEVREECDFVGGGDNGPAGGIRAAAVALYWEGDSHKWRHQATTTPGEVGQHSPHNSATPLTTLREVNEDQEEATPA